MTHDRRFYGGALDLCTSWVSDLARTPQRLAVLGMNAHELERNPRAHQRVVRDLNGEPALPNRCFPTKAIRGWLATDDEFHARPS